MKRPTRNLPLVRGLILLPLACASALGCTENETSPCAPCARVGECCEALVESDEFAPPTACDSYLQLESSCEMARSQGADVTDLANACEDFFPALDSVMSGLPECRPTPGTPSPPDPDMPPMGTTIPATQGPLCPGDLVQGPELGTQALANETLSKAVELTVANVPAGLQLSPAYLIAPAASSDRLGVVIAARNDSGRTLCGIEVESVCMRDAAGSSHACKDRTSLEGSSLPDGTVNSCLRPGEVGYFTTSDSSAAGLSQSDVASVSATIGDGLIELDTPDEFQSQLSVSGYSLDPGLKLEIANSGTGTADATIVFVILLDEACVPLQAYGGAGFELESGMTRDQAFFMADPFAGTATRIVVRIWHDDL